MSKLQAALDETLKATIREALIDVLPEVLPSIITKAMPAAAAAPSAPQKSAASDFEGTRFVSMSELCRALDLNRTTIMKRIRAGKLPARKEWPDGRKGWSAEQVKTYFESASPERANTAAVQARLARLGKH